MREQLKMNIDLIIENLQQLNDSNKKIEGNVENQKIGYFPRDFGMGYWDWPQGIGLYGLNKYNSELDTDEYQKYIQEWIATRLAEGKPIKNVNTTAPMLTLAKMYNQYQNICDEWHKWVMTELNRTDEGVIQHVTSNIDGTGVWLNDGEIWIDTIFMTVLFLNQMSINKNDINSHHEAEYQILQHIKYLYNKDEQLFYHGFNFNGKHNFGKVYWCRGNSWFTLGMIDYLEQEIEAGREMTSGFRFIKEVYSNQALKLIELRNNDKLWNTVLTNNKSYTEVSGSSAICAALLKGIRLGILDSKYKDQLLESIEMILENISDDGVVNNVSAGTAIGMDESHYINIIKSPMAYGQSLTLVALIEALNHV